MKRTLTALVLAVALAVPAVAGADILNLSQTFQHPDGTVWPQRTRAGCNAMLSLGTTVQPGTVLTVKGRWNTTILSLGTVTVTQTAEPTYFTVRLWFGTTWVWVEQGRVPDTSNQVPITC